MMMRLRVHERKEGKNRGVNLWLPLFLFWVLLLPLILPAALTWGILRLIGTVNSGALNVARFMEAGIDVLKNIDGLEIDIRSEDSRFILHF